MIPRLLAVAAGIWLMASPAVLDYGNPAMDNERIFGPIAGAFAFVAIWEIARPLRWATVPVGVWLVISPLVLGYDSASAIASSLIAGIVMIGTAPFGGERRERYGGGWSTLLPGRGVPPADSGTPDG
jgi:hypothetical protein